MERINLVPIYIADRRRLLRELALRLEATFGLPVEVRSPWFDPEVSFDASRGQYSSTLLLEQLLGAPGAAATRVLGLTSVDLFIPVLTYVFGEAQVPGRAAVVSLHRLRSELYGLPRDDVALAARVEKEAVHELGHTYGLIHCPDPACVMHASTYVEEIDLKGAAFCVDCGVAVRGGGGDTA